MIFTKGNNNEFSVSLAKRCYNTIGRHTQLNKIIHRAIKEFEKRYTGINAKSFLNKFMALTDVLRDKKYELTNPMKIKINNQSDLELIQEIMVKENGFKTASDFLERIIYFELSGLWEKIDTTWVETRKTVQSSGKHNTRIPYKLREAIKKYKHDEQDKHENEITNSEILADALNDLKNVLEKEGRETFLKVLQNDRYPKQKNRCEFSYTMKRKHLEFILSNANKRPYISNDKKTIYHYPKNTVDFIVKCLIWHLRKKGYIAF
jgi:hypothetical protein